MNQVNRLALFGGTPVITTHFKKYSSLDETDHQAILHVLKSGNLSNFLGDAGEFFLGGSEVKKFEGLFCKLFEVKFAVSVNSWTSGLWAAIGSLELEPGSEVITSSWTMAATATTILHWNCVPVFADIDNKTFNLNPQSVEANITKRTRAIVSPDIFGQSADIESLKKLCIKYNLFLVSDTAQAPMATRNGYFAGTASDVAGFSFNYHKHIQTGEGGMLVTNNSELSDRLQLLRNHGEVVVSRRNNAKKIFGIMGMNMRLGEMEAALGSNQLQKLKTAVISRRSAADRFTQGIMNLPGLYTPYVELGNDHVYYVYGLRIDPEVIPVSRNKIIEALEAEGVRGLMAGYQNLHKLPLFNEQLTYKKNALPYSLLPEKRARELKFQNLPEAEFLHNYNFIGINWCAFELSYKEIDQLIEAFRKVWNNLEYLK